MSTPNWRWLIVCVALAVPFSSCESLSYVEGGEYPATLEPLPEQQIEQRTAEFHQANDSHMCSLLTEFGLTIGTGCVSAENTPDSALKRDDAIARARQELADNEAYTNVHAPEDLRLRRASQVSGAPGVGWRVEFMNQIHEELEVHDTSITIWLDANGAYRIDGHWYEDITMPESDRITRSEAMESAVGYSISFSDWTGGNQLVVDEEDLPSPDEVQMSVLPYHLGDRLELRVVWDFTVADDFARLFVDAVSGEVLDHEQLIVF